MADWADEKAEALATVIPPDSFMARISLDGSKPAERLDARAEHAKDIAAALRAAYERGLEESAGEVQHMADRWDAEDPDGAENEVLVDAAARIRAKAGGGV